MPVAWEAIHRAVFHVGFAVFVWHEVTITWGYFGPLSGPLRPSRRSRGRFRARTAETPGTARIRASDRQLGRGATNEIGGGRLSVKHFLTIGAFLPDPSREFYPLTGSEIHSCGLGICRKKMQKKWFCAEREQRYLEATTRAEAQARALATAQARAEARVGASGPVGEGHGLLPFVIPSAPVDPSVVRRSDKAHLSAAVQVAPGYPPGGHRVGAGWSAAPTGPNRAHRNSRLGAHWC